MKNTHKRIYPKRLPKEKYPEFSDRLKAVMEIRGYSNTELAIDTFTTPAAISSYRSGTRMPSPDILCLLAIALDVSTDFLLGLSEYIYI